MSKEQYVVIVDRCDSEASLVDVWPETKVFGPEITLREVMDWVQPPRRIDGEMQRDGSCYTVKLTRAHG